MASNVTPLPILRRSKRKVSDFYGSEWGVLSQSGFLDLAREREFTGETWRVFAAALGMMEMPSKIAIRTIDIADHLGIRPAAVARQIKLLVAKDVLRPRVRYGWELAPRYGFKGDPDANLRRAPGGELVLVGDR